jgi:hypothetical protein
MHALPRTYGAAGHRRAREFELWVCAVHVREHRGEAVARVRVVVVRPLERDDVLDEPLALGATRDRLVVDLPRGVVHVVTADVGRDLRARAARRRALGGDARAW